ncbi:hypothetical protein [uncultured Campylobacter sp.]|uniref:hypothetical protein n=1 Tax=uncultured Campylobacter sp. TaxID=218934 RepID=UPI00260E3112|nr:hypothetical protein [uncultured Campylobacter sp.]
MNNEKEISLFSDDELKIEPKIKDLVNTKEVKYLDYYESMEKRIDKKSKNKKKKYKLFGNCNE